ncbi:MAG: SCO family protein [Planctomycetes bacterium]|nr:SCO family protein [Planctomycetota bacterium]
MIGHASEPVPFDLGQLGQVPEFNLLERAGVPLGLKELKGKVWVAMFIFTRCQGPCVAMCMEMNRLQDEFRDEEEFALVATTVDPAYDTPEVLRKHAARFEAQEGRWYFLTGTRELIREFAVDGLHVPWREEDPLTHSERFVLVDRTGQMRGFYQLTETGRMKKLREDIRSVLDGK